MSMKPRTGERRHDLDWLRFIAILILLFFHTGMLFNSWGWHIKNPQTHESFRYWMLWLHEWRMPLLLFISGAGTYMALGKRTPGQYVTERFIRLVIPLIFGMFVIVPPQIYFEHINDYQNYGQFYRTVFDFVPYPKGSLSWHHLWFIAYLFLYSLIALPFLLFIRSARSEGLRGKISSMLSKPLVALLAPSLLMVLSQALLRPFFPDETHALVDDWAYFTFYFLFFLAGMSFYSEPRLWSSLGTNRKFFLASALMILVPFYAFYFHLRGFLHFPWSDDTVDTLFSIAAILVSWFTVITVIAFGQFYLNKPHRWLRHFNEGLYPFYILHQTVIIAIGYYITRASWSIFAKFWAVALITLLICLVTYFLVIRPWRFMRFLFGMKTAVRNVGDPNTIPAKASA